MDFSSSGWTAFKDEGSTEPDHSPATIHNQSGKFSIEVRLILWKLWTNIDNVVDDCLCTAHALSQAKHPFLSEKGKPQWGQGDHNIIWMGEIQGIYLLLIDANTRMRTTHERWLFKFYDLAYAKFGKVSMVS